MPTALITCSICRADDDPSDCDAHGLCCDDCHDQESDSATCCPDPECGGNPCTFPGYVPNN